jgi:hypothetical protein
MRGGQMAASFVLNHTGMEYTYPSYFKESK